MMPQAMLKHRPSTCPEHCSSMMHVTRRDETNEELLTLENLSNLSNARRGAERFSLTGEEISRSARASRGLVVIHV